jgi:hypothetical protein
VDITSSAVVIDVSFVTRADRRALPPGTSMAAGIPVGTVTKGETLVSTTDMADVKPGTRSSSTRAARDSTARPSVVFCRSVPYRV